MLDGVGSCVKMDATTPNIIESCWFCRCWMVLAVVCKWMKQLPTLLGVVGSADVGWCWQLRANGWNNSQHYWALLVLQMLDGVSSCVQMDETTPNIIRSCWFWRCWMVLAVVCKWMKQLPTLLGVVGSADVGWCWQLRANGWNNSQHYWALLVLQMLDGVSSCVQMDETTPNIIGSCWFCRCWMVLAVVWKWTQQLPTLLRVVGSADVGWCWQLCENGRNNSQHYWELLVLQMLDGVSSCVQMDETTPNIIGSCWFCRCWMVLAVACKWTQQLPTLLRVVGSADVGWCWQLCANGRKNTQHHWELLVLQMLDGVGSCAKTDATTPNIIGRCWFCRCWMVLAVVYNSQQCKDVQSIMERTRHNTL